MVAAQVWTLIGLLATALFTLLVQMRAGERGVGERITSLQREVGALTAEMHRGFGGLRGDIAVLRAQINREGP